jgi:nicotinate-nucleotide adenylyltransferase
MGGTFDPIHLGHLRAAESVREALDLERVCFVPAGIPPHRPGLLTSPLDRFAMVSLATSFNPSFLVSDLEVRRGGPSYTVDTLRALIEERPGDEVVLIVGSDTFPEMASWKDAERVFSLCSVAVVSRPQGGGPRADKQSLPFPITSKTVEDSGLPISASDIRRRVHEGRSIRYLVPEAVADYIAKRGLYR